MGVDCSCFTLNDYHFAARSASACKHEVIVNEEKHMRVSMALKPKPLEVGAVQMRSDSVRHLAASVTLFGAWLPGVAEKVLWLRAIGNLEEGGMVTKSLPFTAPLGQELSSLT